ncbi:NRDE family protein [Thalassospira sp.]|uniref:NRDE family protein n=1 Tax=Thalassospira sp. TaxID=1912094 RepID=UPI002733CC32|nr:NRDE family protein [Thalassospira sp.]MDP2698364.1 NRDE family protein [Thalassospira sp.]
MCTIVILRRPDHEWPILIGANRDEMKNRPWLPPARHWPDRPDVIAGIDQLGGGTWLGMNEDGVVAAVLNRFGTLGPADDKRSRGELPLEALDHADAIDAARSLADLDGRSWRPFNMVIADNRDAYWLANRGKTKIEIHEIPEGLSILTAHDLNDRENSDRTRRNLPRFISAPVPNPEADDWFAWQALMADTGVMPPDTEHHNMRRDAMLVRSDIGFETISSSLIGLPGIPRHENELARRPIWLFANGQPDSAPYLPVAL